MGRKNLLGERFSRLVVVGFHGRDQHSRSIWNCRCDCGCTKQVHSRHLVNGKTRSCGCLGRESSARNGKVGARKISGQLSHLYNPSLTEHDRVGNRSVKKWKSLVMARLGRSCDICGSTERPQCHHLYSWAKYKQHRLCEENGIVLCKAHHRQFHVWNGGPRNSCTPSDYLRFKAISLSCRTS